MADSDYTALDWTPEGSDVTFHFKKRKVIASWELLDKLREIGQSQNLPIEQISDFITVIMGASHDQMKSIRQDLFKDVTFTRPYLDPKPLLGNEDDVIEDVDQIYTIMFRVLTVNFTSGTPMTGASGADGV